MRAFLLLAIATSMILSGCSAPQQGAAEARSIPADMCNTQRLEMTADGEIAVCDELHPVAPFIKLPASTATLAYAAIDGMDFVTSEGKKRAVPETSQDKEAERHGVLVYELTLSGDTIRSYRPVLRVPETVFLAPILGKAAEGTISARLGDMEYEMEPSLPVRLQFASQPREGAANEVVATIANLDRGVRASDGRCVPALSTHKNATFPAGANVQVTAYRDPSMHAPGDDEFVLVLTVNGEQGGSLMAREWYRGPADLLRGPITFGTYEGVGHGAPGSIPNMRLGVATGGGEAC